jgi:thioredoxin-related protein
MDNTTFKERAVAEILNEKFYPVKFDAESSQPVQFSGRVYTNPNPEGRRSTHKLTHELLGRKTSYPSYVLYDENNLKLTILKGYMTKDNFLPVMEYIGNNIYLNQKWEAYMESKQSE